MSGPRQEGGNLYAGLRCSAVHRTGCSPAGSVIPTMGLLERPPAKSPALDTAYCLIVDADIT
jgi:hypothetical protein